MGLFSKPEVIFVKDTSDSNKYLEKLEALLQRVSGDDAKEIQREIAVTKAGIVGEENILFELKHSDMNMAVLRDIYIETGDGRSAQIDFVVVTPKLIFIIECKNLFGSIEVDSKGNFVRTMEYGGKKHKEGIYSPITQNERHMMVLKDKIVENKTGLISSLLARNTFEKYYKSLVVLANPKTVLNDKYAKKEVKEQVLRADQIVKVMRQRNEESNLPASSKKELLQIAESILKKNKEERPDYFDKYQHLMKDDINQATLEERHRGENDVEENVLINESNTKTADTGNKKMCPKCGSELVLRTAQKGERAGRQFYGCSNFPKCRYILNIE